MKVDLPSEKSNGAPPNNNESIPKSKSKSDAQIESEIQPVETKASLNGHSAPNQQMESVKSVNGGSTIADPPVVQSEASAPVLEESFPTTEPHKTDQDIKME